MDYIFSSRSILIENWNITIIVLLGVISVLFFFKKNVNKKNVKLSEEEYIGEYQPEYENDDLSPSLDECNHVPYNGATVKLPGGIQQFYEMCDNRRSVRQFSKKKMDIEIIKKCVHAAGTSPSGAHTEPWTYCVISSLDIKAKIREIVEAEELENYTKRMSRQWITDLKPFKTNFIKEYLTDAPYLVLIFKQTYGMRNDGKKKQHYYNEISVSISTGIFLCALQSAGLNSLITTPLNCGPALRTLLNRPVNEKLLVLIPVGYAADDCKVPDIGRKSVEDILIQY